MSMWNELSRKAMEKGIPLEIHFDLTWRCNERCEHCYLDHDDHGELTTVEVRGILDQLANAGVMFVTFSGGEVLMRMDFFPILEYARSLMFGVKVKTNAFMIRDEQADRIRELGVHSVQVSIYSYRAEVHDAITKLPGSLKRSLEGIRRLKARGLRVSIANVLMMQNLRDHPGTRALAEELGVEYRIDARVTPKIDGDRSVLSLGLKPHQLPEVYSDPVIMADPESCALPTPVDEDALNAFPCSAGHSFCYISPYGDVFPCVAFPLPTGNLRKQKFLDIWQHSPEMNEVRSIRLRDMPVCSTCAHGASCSRCPGLAYMEGNMRGPSYQDCEKNFALTGIPTANMIRKFSSATGLVQIAGAPANLMPIVTPPPQNCAAAD